MERESTVKCLKATSTERKTLQEYLGPARLHYKTKSTRQRKKYTSSFSWGRFAKKSVLNACTEISTLLSVFFIAVDLQK